MSDDLVNRLRREAGTLATMYDAATEIERLRAERVTIPEGYAVVPVEPTMEMCLASPEAAHVDVQLIWASMIAAGRKEST
jgi:hypothetical protein